MRRLAKGRRQVLQAAKIGQFRKQFGTKVALISSCARLNPEIASSPFTGLRPSQSSITENIMRHSSFALRLLVAALSAASLLASSSAFAARFVEVTVVNRSTGEQLTPYRHSGKLYVAGSPGDKYALEVRSRSGERVLTVISVDGVNVLTGQTAAAGQSGYVLDPWRSYSINGWRKSMDDVAQFVFTALPDSYAARTGRPDNVGVIGVAVFREKVQPPVAVEPWRGSLGALAKDSAWHDRGADSGSLTRQAPASPATLGKAESASGELAERRADSSAMPERQEAKRLGTGHGEREHSPTQWTDFVRASDSPAEVVTIYYDSRANLVARGIIRGPRVVEPNAFPGGFAFVPDPRS
jgi:hypothetical protein